MNDRPDSSSGVEEVFPEDDRDYDYVLGEKPDKDVAKEEDICHGKFDAFAMVRNEYFAFKGEVG